ncbi:hypothetical protein NECAME_01295 [Necator americanus]|uniref:Peptidase family A16 n=1 Tax=Necator americanus TaxID=51031 RepID=W2U188_NECAM|nr:hypothetical protein NECAME_01295 [Necator americanus]ETN87136.1 hypothetical protein NECAME_01295 [Necator americanus]
MPILYNHGKHQLQARQSSYHPPIILRQQIGIAKRQLRKALEESQTEHAEEAQIQQLKDDDILAAYEEHTSAHDSLHRVYSRLDRVRKQWQGLLRTNLEEEDILQQYITKYGDFRLLLNDAVSILERLDHERPLIENELRKRDLNFEPYTESDVDSQPSSEPSTIHHASRPTTIPTVNMTPYIPDSQTTATANISFVDASILSKGRTLQTIKGLSIAATNYPIAVEILKNHLDDRVTTRHILYTRLASLPPYDKDGRNLFALYSQMYALVRQFTTYEDDSKEYALGAILLNKLPRRIRSRIYDGGKNQENLVPTELLRILTKIVRKETTLGEMEDHRDYTNKRIVPASLQDEYDTQYRGARILGSKRKT